MTTESQDLGLTSHPKDSILLAMYLAFTSLRSLDSRFTGLVSKHFTGELASQFIMSEKPCIPLFVISITVESLKATKEVGHFSHSAPKLSNSLLSV